MANSKNAITGELGRLAASGRLAENGILSFPTPPNYPAADLVIYEADGGVHSKPLFVQVKTSRGKQGNFWLLGQIDKISDTPDSLWWIFVDLRPTAKQGPAYFVVPGREVKSRADAPTRGNSFDGHASIKRTAISAFENDWKSIREAFTEP